MTLTRLPSILLLLVVPMFLALGCGGEKTTQPAAPYSVISTYAGDGVQGQGADGLPPHQTSLYWPQDITFAADGRALILDWNNHRVRMVENGITRTIIGTGELGNGLDGPGLETKLNHPTHVSLDPQGRLIMSAWHNSKVMRYDFSTKLIETICGDGQRSYGGDGGPAEDAILNLPVATVWDSRNRLYIMDQANRRIRIVENGIIESFAGTGVAGYSGDGGLASEAQFQFPVGQAAWPAGKITIDADDNIYVPDAGNHRVRIIEADTHLPAPGVNLFRTDNIIRTIAGTGVAGSSGDGGPAVEATLRFPGDVAVGPDGDIFIADTFNHCVRRVDANGIITTFAGQIGVRGYGGDGGHPTEALLAEPTGVAFDPEGNLYIADRVNNRIRVIRR